MEHILNFFTLSNQERYNLLSNSTMQGYLYLKSNVYPPVNALIEPYVSRLDTIEIIVLAVLLNTLLFFVVSLIIKLLREILFSGILNPFGWKKMLFRFALRRIPFAKRKFEQQAKKLENEFHEELDKQTSKKTFKVPTGGWKYSTLQERLKTWTERDDKIYKTGKLSGSIYIESKDFEEKMKDFCKEFFYTNPLHADLFPTCRQMEAELISMTGDLFGQGKEPCGCVTSGGTESIGMAMLTYRNWARDVKGITNPEIVMPVTAHSAFDKAGSYYGIKIVKIPVDPKTWAVDMGKLAKAINKNTICIVGSAPNFPHGIVDPIPELGRIAKKKNIGLHVDACLGGFCIAWAIENGAKIPKFDFTVEGVTSISVDHHKYGLAPKGVSIVLYKNKALRHYQYYATFSWPGGVYATPGAAGSRSGAPSAGAWFAMMYTGNNAYKENSRIVLEATKKIANAVRTIPQLTLIGDPKVCVVAFASAKKNLNIYSLHYALSQRGWHLSALHLPPAIHISVTLPNARRADELIKDIRECLEEVLKHPENYKGGSVAMYGTASVIPDASAVEEVTKYVVDAILKL